MNTVTKEFIIPLKVLPGMAVLVVVVCFVQLLIYGLTLYKLTVDVADVPCTVKEFVSEAGDVRANIKCGTREAHVSNSDFIAAYLTKPQPFTCTFYKGPHNPICKLPKQ